MATKKLQVEFNANLKPSNDTFKVGNAVVMITPEVGEDYWLFRVKLFKNQAIIAFPKFTTLGIGFAQEKDWNTNLPYHCDTEEIYNHISHNKKHKEITKKSCIEAIKLIQQACTEFKLGF